MNDTEMSRLQQTGNINIAWLIRTWETSRGLRENELRDALKAIENFKLFMRIIGWSAITLFASCFILKVVKIITLIDIWGDLAGLSFITLCFVPIVIYLRWRTRPNGQEVQTFCEAVSLLETAQGSPVHAWAIDLNLSHHLHSLVEKVEAIRNGASSSATQEQSSQNSEGNVAARNEALKAKLGLLRLLVPIQG